MTTRKVTFHGTTFSIWSCKNGYYYASPDIPRMSNDYLRFIDVGMDNGEGQGGPFGRLKVAREWCRRVAEILEWKK